MGAPREFCRSAEGSVTILAAFGFVALAIATALSVESANLYLAKLQNQRAADLGNLAAAGTSSPIVNNAPSAMATATAANVVAINGLTGARVATTVVASPRSVGSSALSTVVTRDMSRLFGGVLGGTATAVGARSVADLGGGTGSGSCLASLVGPTNIYGTSNVSGLSCGINATTFLYVCGSANVAVARVGVGYSMQSEAPYICNTASMSPGPASFSYKAAPTDTIAASPDMVAIKSHLLAMGSAGWPYGSTSPRSLMNPAVTAGTDLTYPAGTIATLSQGTRYRNLQITSSTLTFTGNGVADPTCATPTTISGNIVLNGNSTLTFASGCYVVAGYVTAHGGANTVFAAAPGATATFVFKQYITNGSGTMTLPDASYSIAGNVNNNNGGTMSFGDGVKVFGAGIVNTTGTLGFGTGPHYVNGGTITNGTGTMTFGNGDFYLWGGSMSNSSSGSMRYGNGTFYFYGGTVYNVSGSLVFGNGPFYFKGGSVSLSRGSTTRFGVGNIDFYGGTITMAGASTTIGYGGSATTGSSTVSLYGGSLSLTTASLTAVGVTFAFYGGTISLLGVGTINATAPTDPKPTLGYRNILFVVYGGAFNLYQSAAVTDTMSGLIYVPATNVSIYGSQTVQYPAGGCFQVVAGVLDIYQKARLNVSPCAGIAMGSGSGTATLVQ